MIMKHRLHLANIVRKSLHMVPRSLKTAGVCALFTLSLYCMASGADVSLLGEKDYADGTVIGVNSTWLTAQSNESYPFNTIHAAPATVTYIHTGLDTGRQGVLTFSLWDLDSELA